MKKILLTISAISLIAGIASYAATIKGRVVDSYGETLPGATYSLINLSDTVVRRHDAVADDATFYIDSVAPGQYAMLVEFTGMDPARFNFFVPDSVTTVDLSDIALNEESTMLAETVVTAVKAAVIARQDTLEFNAGSFRTQQNATVEDLLKKLPGVEVGSDGSVSSGGKSITKILVNGKEFFSDDPQLATKNLTADMVEKVQVIDRKSDLARLTGVDDGEDETVINLTVKKDMNCGWFGNLQAGYGTDNRYQGAANINYFNNGNQVSLILGGNNINEMGFGDRGRGNFRDFGGNNGILNSQRIGLNFNVGNEEKFRIGGNVFYSYSDRDSRYKSATQYLFPDSTSYQNSGGVTQDIGHNIRADLRMQWNIDQYNTIDFRPRFSWSSRHSQMQDSTLLRAGDAMQTLVNETQNLKDNRGTSVSAEGTLIYNHSFASKKGRSFSVQGKYAFSNTLQHSLTWSELVYYLMQDDSEELYRYLDTKQWSNTAEGRLTWTEPLGDVSRGNFLQVAYRASYKWNNADRLTYNLPIPEDAPTFPMPDYKTVPELAIFDSDLSNSFRNKFYTHELQLGYKKVAAMYNLEAGMIFSPSGSQSEDLINSERNIPLRKVWNVAPFARLRYKFSKTQSLMANYRARTSQPSLTALQPVADVSDPLNITIGNPELKPTFTQSLMAHYNNYITETQQSIFAVMRASVALNNVTQRTTTDKQTGGRITEYTNTNGLWNLMGMGMWTGPLPNRSWRLNGRLQATWSSTPGFINGDYNRSNNLRLSPSAGVTFSSDIFQFSLNPTYTFQAATSSLAAQANRYIHTGGFQASAVVQLPFGLEVSTDYTFAKSSGYAAGYNNTDNLWNAQISYSVLNDKSLTFSVSAYDLLGKNKNISRSVSADKIVDSEYNDLTRYVMFGVSWKFNTMKKKAVEVEEFGPMPGPGSAGDRPQGPPPGMERGGTRAGGMRGGFGGPPPTM